MRPHRWALLAAASLFAVSACQEVPYTHRSQLHLLSDAEEQSLGAQGYQETLGKEKQIKSGAQYEAVKRVAMKIAAAAEDPDKGFSRPDYKWEVALIDSPQVNAWCMPGGKMGVYTGILPVTQTDTGLAVVLGHEVAHALAHHGNERISQGAFAEAVLNGLQSGMSVSSMSPGTQQAVMAALGAGTQVGVMLPFSRTHESEADHIGLILMAKAGYDPREAPKFWERMSSMSSGGKPPELLSTHPSDATRIRDLKSWIPEAQKYYKP